MRILVAEDESRLAELISQRLKKENYTVSIASNGAQALDEALSGIYDLVILDIMMPHVNGFQVLKAMKEEKIDSKVIILSARGELDDKLTGLQGGADDYVTKPFHLEELAARVNVQLRKGTGLKPADVLETFDLKLKMRDSRLTCQTTQESIDIAGKEYQLMEIFMHNPGQILPKDQLYDRVWGLDSDLESNNLEVYLSFLRKKLKAIGSRTTIKAVRGLGYRMEEKHE